VLVVLASACGNDASAPVVFDARPRVDARLAPDAHPAIDAPLVVADALPLLDAPPPTIDAAPAPDAGPTVFHVTLTKEAEVPVCANAGTNATGTATVTINAAGTSIAVSGFEYSGLSGDGVASAAHIHFGATGANGPVVLPFDSAASPINQTFTAQDYMASPSSPPTFAMFVTAMRAGQSYLNIHTSPQSPVARCPDGEIRGQIQ
jgi:hypothetical protein